MSASSYHTEELEMNDSSNEVANVDDDEDDDGNVVLRGVEREQHVQPFSFFTLIDNAIHTPNQVMAMLSNYSTSYNVVNVGIALPVMNYYLRNSSLSSSTEEQQQQSEYSSPYRSLVDISDENDNNNNDKNNEQQQNSLVASSLMAGMIIGQLLGGILGDILGRKTAMILVMVLQIGGSLGSAIFVSTTAADYGGGLTTLEQLAIWRFILGVGAGGVYPLAAVMSAETSTATKEKQQARRSERIAVNTVDDDDDEAEGERLEENSEQQNDNNDTALSFQRIALTFSTQGLGFITVPLLAYPMLELGMNTNIIWRILLGMGSLPGLIVLYLRLKDNNNCGRRRRNNETDDMIAVTTNNNHPTESLRNDDDDDNMMTATIESTATTGSDDSNERALIDNSYLEDNNDTATTSRRCRRIQSRGLWESIKAEPNLATKLLGTAGTWFLFDIVFYGNALFEPVVLEAAFGSSGSANNANNDDDFGVLRTVVRDSLVISCLSLPGYFITVALIGRRTCVNIMCRSIRSSFSSTRFGSLLCCPPYDQTPGKWC